ncbi:MAG TPA: hypothetical protein PKE66_16245, partial [Pyrinomonadaceae bacterium]|nr:hypothetical protein [Pyrinomonadaceae bacterium]
SHTEWTSKQRSELHLLGFASGGQLTDLGVRSAAADTEEEFARLWVSWLKSTPDTSLNGINPRLKLAKRVFGQFWKLQHEVRAFFLENAVNPNEDIKRLLQTIELLCNADDVVQELTLEEVKGISKLLRDQSALPPATQNEIFDYFGNKGVRSWGGPDRKTLPLAWNEV